MPNTSPFVEGYRAITENVPKTFPQALRDPVWGDPARLEFETILTTTKSLVRMDTAIARQHISSTRLEPLPAFQATLHTMRS